MLLMHDGPFYGHRKCQNAHEEQVVVHPGCCCLSYFIYMWSVYVDMRILKASVESVRWGGMRSHFCVKPNYCVEVVLKLCFVVVRVVTICYKTCRSVESKGEN